VVHYDVANAEILDMFLQDYAPGLLAQASSHFGDQFAFTERVMVQQQTLQRRP
jgi:hypothetical protein